MELEGRYCFVQQPSGRGPIGMSVTIYPGLLRKSSE
jgi:hypothetical protein